MASQRSLYDVLNVSSDAEPVVIDAAYRALMKKYHPDQAAEAAESSQSAADINRAFAILRDPTRRADYDHREWTKRQAFRLAESQAAQPARPRSAFGWGGWFVALLLGIVLFVLINGRGGVVAPMAGNENMPVASAEPDHRSQPAKIEPAFFASTGPNEVDREILAREAATAADVLETRAAEPEADSSAEAAASEALAEVAPPEAKRRAASAPRPRAKAPRQGAARPAESEEDFLQREGYIY